jgi:hypothetical protein
MLVFFRLQTLLLGPLVELSAIPHLDIRYYFIFFCIITVLFLATRYVANLANPVFTIAI